MEKTNVLIALRNILEFKQNKLMVIYGGRNRINNIGDALEYYAKDLFCNSINVDDFKEKEISYYPNYLSYLGNKNNPPDFIIRAGEAVEVKKIEGLEFNDIALNSSYPKDYLYSDSTLIKSACKHCEDDISDGWEKKDMIYFIGNVNEDELKVLWILYGNCYSANKEVYEDIKMKIKEGITKIPDVEFRDTNELGKVNKIDPLGITNLRIRGMWSIKHPMRVFDYLVKDYYDETLKLQVYCLMLKKKYDEFPTEDKNALIKYINEKLLIKREVKIKDPNNPAKLLDAVFFVANIQD